MGEAIRSSLVQMGEEAFFWCQTDVPSLASPLHTVQLTETGVPDQTRAGQRNGLAALVDVLSMMVAKAVARNVNRAVEQVLLTRCAQFRLEQTQRLFFVESFLRVLRLVTTAYSAAYGTRELKVYGEELAERSKSVQSDAGSVSA